MPIVQSPVQGECSVEKLGQDGSQCCSPPTSGSMTPQQGWREEMSIVQLPVKAGADMSSSAEPDSDGKEMVRECPEDTEEMGRNEANGMRSTCTSERRPASPAWMEAQQTLSQSVIVNSISRHQTLLEENLNELRAAYKRESEARAAVCTLPPAESEARAALVARSQALLAQSEAREALVARSQALLTNTSPAPLPPAARDEERVDGSPPYKTFKTELAAHRLASSQLSRALRSAKALQDTLSTGAAVDLKQAAESKPRQWPARQATAQSPQADARHTDAIVGQQRPLQQARGLDAATPFERGGASRAHKGRIHQRKHVEKTAKDGPTPHQRRGPNAAQSMFESLLRADADVETPVRTPRPKKPPSSFSPRSPGRQPARKKRAASNTSRHGVACQDQLQDPGFMKLEIRGSTSEIQISQRASWESAART